MMSQEKLFRLIKEDDVQTLKQFIRDHYDDTSWLSFHHGKSGDTCLLVAARCGQKDVLRFLLEEMGANIERVNLDGKTALHEAAQYGQLEAVEYLLSRGANVDSLKRADWTPVMLACTKSSLAVIQKLVENGAQLHLVNKDGWNALHIACREGHVDIVKYLLDMNGKIWQTTSKNGRTPLHTVALHGHDEVAELLLSACDYDCDTVDSCGTTPLMDALRMGFIKMADLLVHKQGVSVTCTDNMGRQAIHLAAQAGCERSVLYLVKERGVSVNTPSTSYQTTPAHVAAKENQNVMLELLVSLGADVNLCDCKGRTPLHIAAGCQHGACVRTLLSHGAINKADHAGTFARDMVFLPELQQLFDTSIS